MLLIRSALRSNYLNINWISSCVGGGRGVRWGGLFASTYGSSKLDNEGLEFFWQIRVILNHIKDYFFSVKQPPSTRSQDSRCCNYCSWYCSPLFCNRGIKQNQIIIYFDKQFLQQQTLLPWQHICNFSSKYLLFASFFANQLKKHCDLKKYREICVFFKRQLKFALWKLRFYWSANVF